MRQVKGSSSVPAGYQLRGGKTQSDQRPTLGDVTNGAL